MKAHELGLHVHTQAHIHHQGQYCSNNTFAILKNKPQFIKKKKGREKEKVLAIEKKKQKTILSKEGKIYKAKRGKRKDTIFINNEVDTCIENRRNKVKIFWANPKKKYKTSTIKLCYVKPKGRHKFLLR